MKYTKVRKVKSPSRAHKNDAGIDLFIPEDIDAEVLQKINSTIEGDYNYNAILNYRTVEAIEILPHRRVLIPSGIHVNVPEGHALIAHNKSGVTHKRGLIVGSSVVDTGYMGEMGLSVINTNDHPVTIFAGEKIMQFILQKISCDMPEEVETVEALYTIKTTRGTGGFGSTGE